MSYLTLIRRSLTHHAGANAAVLLGVMVATAVLTGALLIGDSLRGSMQDQVRQRLGQVDVAVATDRFFRADLAQRWQQAGGPHQAVAAVVLRGSVTAGEQRVNKVQIVGIDEHFPPFYGVAASDPGTGIWVNQHLAQRLQASEGTLVEIRIDKPQAVPSDSLLGRPVEEAAVVLEASPVTQVLSNDGLGGFTLDAMQQQPLIAYVQLRRLQGRLRESMQLNNAANLMVASLGEGQRVDQLQSALNSVAELEDLGLRLNQDHSGHRYLAMESRRMIVEPEVVAGVRQFTDSSGLNVEPTLTYLANRITFGDRSVPYSTVTGLYPQAEAPFGPLLLTHLRPTFNFAEDSILLNDWVAKDLGINPEQTDDVTIELTYFKESDGWLLKEETTSFKLAGVVKLEGAANDRSLTPEFPGMRATSIRDWTPPFPKEQWHPDWVKERDEQYWRRYRATPKAFIHPDTAAKLWHSKHGEFTSLRIAPRNGQSLADLELEVRRGLRTSLSPEKLGLKLRDVKDQGLAATGSSTVQSFGWLFLGFSFFLIVAAMLLVSLLYRLGLEQRASELGLLFATGFRLRSVRWLVLVEGLLIAVVGGLLGLLLAVAYAWLLLKILNRFWSSSLQTSFLELHVATREPLFGPLPYPSLLIGFVLSVAMAAITLLWSTRVLGRLAARELLSGRVVAEGESSKVRIWQNWVGVILAVAAMALACASFFVPKQIAAPLFFGSGACVLGAGILALGWQLRDRRRPLVYGTGVAALTRLGAGNAERHRTRSLLTAGLLASAVFLIVAVEAFRKSGDAAQTSTGGYAAIIEADVPLFLPPTSAEARKGMLPDATPAELERLTETLQTARIAGFKLRPGDDVSCQNLYQPQQPRILGVPVDFIQQGGFKFSAMLEPTPEEKQNPWLLLNRTTADAVPLVADDHTATWVLHKQIGDRWTITNDRGEPVMVQLVGLVHDSIFQSELLVSELQFRRLFPTRGGYGYFLVEPVAAAAALEQAFGKRNGVTLTPAADRLAGFHAVENTYLSTFQMLGGMGLLLGTLGVAIVLLRNVWERASEFALLRAVGFRDRALGVLVMAENGFLLVAGLLVGVVAALVAVFPHALERAGGLPWIEVGVLLLAVLAIGALAGIAATWRTLRLPLLPSLRRD